MTPLPDVIFVGQWSLVYNLLSIGVVEMGSDTTFVWPQLPNISCITFFGGVGVCCAVTHQ